MRLLAFFVLLSACVPIPAFHDGDGGVGSGSDDGSGSGSNAVPAVRWIANAYRDGGDDSIANGTYMMSKAGYAIPTAGIFDGDLVLFIGNVDNGSQDFWNLPAGFSKVVQRFYGQDGQTYVVGWKVAAGEPQLYTGTYKVGVSSSAAATISLLAVSNYNQIVPIAGYIPSDHPTPTDPADTGSPGLTTTADNSLLIFAGGADWTPENGKNTFAAPDGFQALAEVGDRETHWDWTCQALTYKLQATAGFTGALTSTMSAVSYADNTMHIPGGGWSVLLAINPR